jgi:hypothetical protein
MADAFKLPREFAANSALEQPDRRRDLRIGVNLDVVVEELQAQTRVKGRITDLSLGGCYVDVMAVFPLATPVKVHIFRDDQKFLADAEVRYSKAGLGMGLEFADLNSEQKATLAVWAGDLSKTAPVEPVTEISSPASVRDSRGTTGDRDALHVLIKILMHKGTLTHGEAEQVLREWTKNTRKQ